MFHVAKQFCKILKDFNRKLQFLCYPQKNAVSYLSFLVSVFEINNKARAPITLPSQKNFCSDTIRLKLVKHQNTDSEL